MLVQPGLQQKTYGDYFGVRTPGTLNGFNVSQLTYKINSFFGYPNSPTIYDYPGGNSIVFSTNKKIIIGVHIGYIYDSLNNICIIREFISKDSGQTWTQNDLYNSSVVPSFLYQMISMSGDGKYVIRKKQPSYNIYTQNNLYISNDYGVSYSQPSYFNNHMIIAGCMSDTGQYMYIITRNDISGYEFWRSDNYGTTFTSISLGSYRTSSNILNSICCSKDGSIIYLPAQASTTYAYMIKKSIDYGVSFTEIKTTNSSFVVWENVVCSANGLQYAYIERNGSITSIYPYGVGGNYAGNLLLGIDKDGNVYSVSSVVQKLGTLGGTFYSLLVTKSSREFAILCPIYDTPYIFGQRHVASDDIILQNRQIFPSANYYCASNLDAQIIKKISST